jgi:hypothetical protein
MPKKESYDSKRRKLLKFLGLSSFFATGASATAQVRIEKVLNPNARVLATGTAANFITVKLLRPEDLLSLELRFYNFSLSGETLQKKGDPAYLVVVFQPQSMSEQAWIESSSGLEIPAVPGKMIIGGDSRLVFQIPASISNIPLKINNLLAWEQFDLVVNDRAKAPAYFRTIAPGIINQKLNEFQRKILPADLNKIQSIKRAFSKDEKTVVTNMTVAPQTRDRNIIGRITEGLTQLVKDPVGPPGELETSLEVPVRLYLSPTKNAGWKHKGPLKIDNGILKETNKLFELWHTRMGVKKGNTVDDSDPFHPQQILRALWADDANKDYNADVSIKELDNQLGLTSITNKQRHQIVHESSNFLIPGYIPKPIKAYKLFLTALGAWLDSEFVVERKSLEKAGIFQGRVLPDAPAGKNGFILLKWRHIETMGREHYVEIVEAGNIMPFGHEAVLITITERKPHPGTGTAANFQRQIVVITETTKDYNYRDSKGEFLNFSFSSIEFITTVSPLLDPAKTPFVTPSGPPAIQQFIIKSGGKEVPFKIKGKDLDGNTVDFTMPLIFVSGEILGNAATRQSLIDRYNNAGLNPNNNSHFNGQRFTLAEKAKNATDTAYASHAVTFRVRPYSDPDELQGFLPEIGTVDIIEPSCQRLTGFAKPISVSLYDDDNDGHVFAKFNFSQPISFAGNSDKTGGLAAPNFNLSGLSKAAGAFGGNVDLFSKAQSAAGSYFNVNNLPDPTLFGVFKLSDILDFASGDKSSYDLSKPLLNRLPKIPNLTTEDTGDAFITSYILKPGLKGFSNSIVGFVVNNNKGFSIETQVKAKKGTPTTPPPAPEFSTFAGVKDFSVGIIKVSGSPAYLININFIEIGFKTATNKKPDVSVVMKDPCISFGGPLKFLNEINKLIDPKGFYDPPYLDVSLTGIKCGYTLALPNLQLGAFTLSHLSLGAEVNLPFTGAPLTMGFRFCERQQPFTLTFSCLGGGGFFGFEVDMHGLRQIEAALEFGAAVSINLGVASGAVSIMAGIYFKMTFESGQNSTQLTGYVRINGAVSVLGLITASIELYMALTYLIDKEKAYGEATLKIKVEVLFFSKTVTLHTQRTFAGSGSDPNFQTAISPTDWKEYCEAFAA